MQNITRAIEQRVLKAHLKEEQRKQRDQLRAFKDYAKLVRLQEREARLQEKATAKQQKTQQRTQIRSDAIKKRLIDREIKKIDAHNQRLFKMMMAGKPIVLKEPKVKIVKPKVVRQRKPRAPRVVAKTRIQIFKEYINNEASWAIRRSSPGNVFSRMSFPVGYRGMGDFL